MVKVSVGKQYSIHAVKSAIVRGFPKLLPETGTERSSRYSPSSGGSKPMTSGSRSPAPLRG
jgi:hypothetical protein